MELDLHMDKRDAAAFRGQPDALAVEELGAADLQIGADHRVVDVVVGVEVAVADGMHGEEGVGGERGALVDGNTHCQSFTFT